jgi:hypothetical protein
MIVIISNIIMVVVVIHVLSWSLLKLLITIIRLLLLKLSHLHHWRWHLYRLHELCLRIASHLLGRAAYHKLRTLQLWWVQHVLWRGWQLHWVHVHHLLLNVQWIELLCLRHCHYGHLLFVKF